MCDLGGAQYTLVLALTEKFLCRRRLFRLFAIRLTASQLEILALIFRIFASLVFFIRSGLSFKDFVSLRSSRKEIQDAR